MAFADNEKIRYVDRILSIGLSQNNDVGNKRKRSKLGWNLFSRTNSSKACYTLFKK